MQAKDANLCASSFILLTVLAGSVGAADRGNAQNPISQVIERRIASTDFAGVVLVADSSTFLIDKGYGSANLEWKAPNTPTTRFRLGSITKQFTAAAILILEEHGKLHIEDPVSKYLQDAPEAWGPITLRHLLTHTSGIPDFTDLPEFADLQNRPATPDKLIATFRSKPLDFPPGSDFKYSNSGYIVLGYIIEKLTGSPYADFIEQKIFTPLHMEHSGYDASAEVIPMRAQGYVKRDGKLFNAEYIDMSVPFSAGGLYSTTEDLLRWEHGLFEGSILSANELDKMTTPFKRDYAFGVAVGVDADGNKLIAHGGEINGFSTFLAYIPAKRFAVIILSNIEGAPTKDMAADIFTIAGHSVPGWSRH